MSLISWIEAKTVYYWTTDKIKTGYRIAVRQRGLTNKLSAGYSDEIGYIHVVPSMAGYFEILNVEIAKDFQRQGLGAELYRRAYKEVKKAGGRGLMSESRTPDAERVWKKLKGAKKKNSIWFLD